MMHGLQEFDREMLGKPHLDFWVFVACLVIWAVACAYFWWRT